MSISLYLLAFAVSLDSFSVGLTYGLRKIRIPLKSIIMIASCSAIVLLAAMAVGNIVDVFMSPQIAEKIGGTIFLLLGGWILFQFFRPQKEKESLSHEKTIINLEIKSLGIVINILRKPTSADFDKSGSITGIEAFMLGLALSLDAFGAGIGASLLNFPPAPLAIIVALMSSLFVMLGMKLGAVLAKNSLIQKFSLIPGIVLIFLGIWKL